MWQRRDKMEKEYAEYMYQRLSADTAIRLIRSFPLRAVDRDVLIDGLVGHQGRRGWQKVYAYEIGGGRQDGFKTVSKRPESVRKVLNCLCSRAFGAPRKVENRAFLFYYGVCILNLKRVKELLFTPAFFINVNFNGETLWKV